METARAGEALCWPWSPASTEHEFHTHARLASWFCELSRKITNHLPHARAHRKAGALQCQQSKMVDRLSLFQILYSSTAVRRWTKTICEEAWGDTEKGGSKEFETSQLLPSHHTPPTHTHHKANKHKTPHLILK